VVLNWHAAGKKNVDDQVHDVSGQIMTIKDGRDVENFPYAAFELMRKSSDVLSVVFAYRPARRLNVMVLGQAEVRVAVRFRRLFSGLALSRRRAG
jgi:hypothetical protein